MVKLMEGSLIERDPCTGEYRYYYKGRLFGTLRESDIFKSDPSLTITGELTIRWIHECEAKAKDAEARGELGSPTHPLCINRI
jgi:hypothetical protein